MTYPSDEKWRDTPGYPQIAVVIKTPETVISFRSMAQCDAFLKRAKGYTSNRLKKHNTLIDLDGKVFQVLPF